MCLISKSVKRKESRPAFHFPSDILGRIKYSHGSKAKQSQAKQSKAKPRFNSISISING
jgi:hypothetical protein